MSDRGRSKTVLALRTRHFRSYFTSGHLSASPRCRTGAISDVAARDLTRRSSYAADPNRFQAACRETASASPIVAQLTSRSRRMSAMSCIAASILSKAPLYPAKAFNSASVGALSGNSEGTFCVVALFFFSIIGRQRCTHSSQIKTPGPPTSVLTSVCAFPQNEQ